MLKMSRGRLDVGDVPKASAECRVVVANATNVGKCVVFKWDLIELVHINTILNEDRETTYLNPMCCSHVYLVNSMT